MSSTEATEAHHDLQEPVQDFIFATSSCRHESNAEKVGRDLFDTNMNVTSVNVKVTNVSLLLHIFKVIRFLSHRVTDKKYKPTFVTPRSLIQVCFLIAQAYEDDLAEEDPGDLFRFTKAAESLEIRKMLHKAIDEPTSDEFKSEEVAVSKN